MKSKKEVALKRLDENIERWKKQEDSPWKNWAFGYALCLRNQGVLSFTETEEVLRRRGIVA